MPLCFPVAQRLADALAQSKAVLIVVSAASVKSNWLAFELNKATERMVKGDCRVIPAVKEKVGPPPEVRGLLYADFTGRFDLGLTSVLTALSMTHTNWLRSRLV